jgi:hypothetical protein
MQVLLQDDPTMLDRMYQQEGIVGLLSLVRASIECYRCKGAHYKWQCPAKPSIEEQNGERDPRKWGLVPACVLDPSKSLNRSVCALSGRVSAASEVTSHVSLSVSLQEMRTDMSDLIQEVKGSRSDVGTMEGSLHALALSVQTLQE